MPDILVRVKRQTRLAAAAHDARWVKVATAAALVVFPGLIIFSVFRPDLAGRVVWTVAIASLPLFFVLAGYHRWRRICPLAFIAQVPALFGLAGHRRAGPWLNQHGYRVAFGVFLVSLWLRLVATNGDGHAIATFLIALSLAAFVTGVLFTGKTWCNYVCPVLFVEKLYTEPRGLRTTPNSQCRTCTACRPSCPDINEENGYWKEILHPGKRQVFFAFPGVVLAFYVYYFVQAGTWEYYFGGRWTNQVGLIRTAFAPGTDAATAGVYFLHDVPRAVAAAVTLGAGAVASLALFSLLERMVGAAVEASDEVARKVHVRHVMFSLVAFTAFVAFYAFAGAPTLRLIPGAPHFFQLLVVTTGTLFLVRRIGRRQQHFTEETLARTIVTRWPWTDTPPPADLREAFLVHAARSQRSGQHAQAEMIALYKTAVRECISSGVTSRADVHRLESVRAQLRIPEAEHERVMAELVEEDRGRIGRRADTSPEKRLQIEGYAVALAAQLDRQSAPAPATDDAGIRRLRHQFSVTPEEHEAVVAYLAQLRQGPTAQVLDAPATIEDAAGTIEAIASMHSQVADFLSRLLRRRWTRTVEVLIEAVGGGSGRTGSLREGLLAAEHARREAAITDLASRLPPAAAARLRDGFAEAVRQRASRTDPAAHLRQQLSSPDPYVRATAIYLLQSKGAATADDRQRLEHDEHPLVREVIAQDDASAVSGAVPGPSTLEKMIALCSISLFDALDPEDLIQLARSSTEVWFTEGQVLCREGEIGDEAFILLAGEASVYRRDGGTDRLLAVEGAGSCIGELSVLDPAPRSSTVTVSSIALRALRLTGDAFREARNANPAVSDAITRLLVRRLRGAALDAGARTSPQPESSPKS